MLYVKYQKIKMPELCPNCIQEKVYKHIYFLNSLLVYNRKNNERKIPKY